MVSALSWINIIHCATHLGPIPPGYPRGNALEYVTEDLGNIQKELVRQIQGALRLQGLSPLRLLQYSRKLSSTVEWGQVDIASESGLCSALFRNNYLVIPL